MLRTADISDGWAKKSEKSVNISEKRDLRAQMGGPYRRACTRRSVPVHASYGTRQKRGHVQQSDGLEASGGLHHRTMRSMEVREGERACLKHDSNIARLAEKGSVTCPTVSRPATYHGLAISDTMRSRSAARRTRRV